jgi:ferredoxin
MNPGSELAGKVALVTGGARNIGRAICRSLAAGGASVMVNANTSRSEAEKTVGMIGDRAALHIADVTNPKEVERLVEATVSRFGRIDFLVNNAAVRYETAFADMSYDAAGLVINARYAEFCGQDALAPLCDRARLIKAPFGPARDLAFHPFVEPAASLIALAFAKAELSGLVPVATLGFWLHTSLVLVFLNILPYSKHFHIITAIPNVFLSDLTPPGRLHPMAKTTELLLERVEKASEGSDADAARIGYSKIEHFTWKDLLDLYTCTECGRCTDNCPANKTGKKLSPKQISLDLRGQLYALQAAAVHPPAEGVTGAAPLVPEPIDPDVLWACLTCRACEEQCPVGITYVEVCNLF